MHELIKLNINWTSDIFNEFNLFSWCAILIQMNKHKTMVIVVSISSVQSLVYSFLFSVFVFLHVILLFFLLVIDSSDCVDFFIYLELVVNLLGISIFEIVQ